MNPLIAEAALSSQGGGDDNPKPEPAISNTHRQDWNSYIGWLDKKGLKGSPSLDHNDLGGQMIDQYRKENPNTSVSRDMVIPIQKEFGKYRDYALSQIQNGKGTFAPGTNKDNFLRSLSIVDNIPGQRTTSYSFPKAYMDTFENGQHTVTDQGYATTQ